MASARKRGKESYLLTVELGYDSLGKRIKRTKTVKAKNKKEADLELAKFIVEVESGEFISPEKMSFEAFVEEWKTKYANKHLELKSIENYVTHLNNRIIPHFKDVQISKIKTMHIIRFLDSVNTRLDGKDGSVSSATTVYIYRVLRSVFLRAVEWNVIKDNPMKGVKKPKEKPVKDIQVYDEEDVRKLFKALEQEPFIFKMLITLAVSTGMRRGELIALEWKHINLEEGTLQVVQSISIEDGGKPVIKEPKTKNSIRTISLPTSTIEMMKQYRRFYLQDKLKRMDRWTEKEHEFVFPNSSGGPLYFNRPTKWWIEFLDYNGLKKIRFHDLRHTSATLLINKGVHAKIISERLGHADITTTMNVYGHALQEADKIAAEKLDSLFTFSG
ncbi:tyrosine-type recombinase/integrase [Paenibacillus sp. JCM 10914]|uniref:tyrosine-type recombinase/integrase n=1 Tax=Paenibacillus sp. JCM 10914 TaxID=1236974 RepID=UPI0003CC5879|nr:site-specific integrase [Paenibacillus sp. JCM 10914]GAE09578.1 integrase [Paenibacillus sp. JCM 10914]